MLDIKTICERLDVAESTVKTQRQRAKKYLRERLQHLYPVVTLLFKPDGEELVVDDIRCLLCIPSLFSRESAGNREFSSVLFLLWPGWYLYLSRVVRSIRQMGLIMIVRYELRDLRCVNYAI